MKHIMRLFLGLLCVGFFLQTNVFAASLQDEYKEVESKREALEKRRQQYANQLKALNLRQHHLTLSLYKCISQKPNRSWEQTLNEAQATSQDLEKKREDIVQLRVELEKIRQDLEKKRLDIEKQHKIKTDGTAYDSAFREYISTLTDQYFTRLENDLFKNYELFFSEIEKYIQFLEKSVQVCN